jgi:6-phosphogluconolactonase
VARLIVVHDAHAVAEAAADRVVAVLGGAIETRGVAHVALSGGSTAVALYRALLEPIRRGAADWSRVEAWWGDDRFVTRDDQHSNARAAFETILAPGTGLGFDARRVHPFPIDEARAESLDPGWVAATYAARLVERLPRDGSGDPIFDLVLLGVGGDGHILSAFPGGAALDPASPIALDVPAPTHIHPHVPRVTLHTRLVSAARAVLVMCHGAAKADRVAEVLEGRWQPDRLPAQLARGANATWILDRAAAAALRHAPMAGHGAAHGRTDAHTP